MIKITFEVSEDFIDKQLDPSYLAEVTSNGKIDFARGIAMMLSCTVLKRQLKEGKTEFTVTPEKLDEKLIEVYKNAMPDIFTLAAFYETDKEEDKDE
jgi:hypothetical protein